MEKPPIAPMLFPHTVVGQDCLEALLAVFERVCLKRPSGGDLPPHLIAARDAERLIVTWPAGDDGRDLRQLASDYRQWLKDNRGAEIRVRHLQRGAPPMVDASSVARLRGQILAGEARGSEGPIDDSRRMAQLFLLAAETWALETADVQAAMAGHTENERALFENLHGDPSELALFPLRPDPVQHIDPCEHMTSQWLSAWCRLVLDDAHIPAVWITFSDAVVSWMREVFGEIREIGMIPRHAVSADGVAGRLDDFLLAATTNTGDSAWEPPYEDAVDRSPAAVILRVTGVSPRMAAARLASRAAAVPPDGAGDAGRHLVLIRWYDK